MFSVYLNNYCTIHDILLQNILKYTNFIHTKYMINAYKFSKYILVVQRKFSK